MNTSKPHSSSSSLPSLHPDLRYAIALDVEANGPASGLHSMIEFALVPLFDHQRAFHAYVQPYNPGWVRANLEAIGTTHEQTLAYPKAAVAGEQLAHWFRSLPSPEGRGRWQVWSDNPGFDWGFFNEFCHRFLGENPFGFSSRRIGDFCAGLRHGVHQTRDWKRYRRTQHTHNALDDAKGNAEALAAYASRYMRAKT